MELKLYAKVDGFHVPCKKANNRYKATKGASYYEWRPRDPVTGKRSWKKIHEDFTTAEERFAVLLHAATTGKELPKEEPKQEKMLLTRASEVYFEDRKKNGLAEETLLKYHRAVDAFIEHCGVKYLEDCNRQALVNYMGWLREQEPYERIHPNPKRTLANKVGDVRIFLTFFGITRLLKKTEKLKFREKIVVAHTDEQLAVLYGTANPEETFLLDFFIGTMCREHEAYGKHGNPQLTGTTLTLYGKQDKNRTVEIDPVLAKAIRRRQEAQGECLFLNWHKRPHHHLLRVLKDLAERAGAKFHVELHKLRKTGASRRYLANEPIKTLMEELGHTSLAVTQAYLADVRKPGEAKQAATAATFDLDRYRAEQKAEAEAEVVRGPQLVRELRRAVGD